MFAPELPTICVGLRGIVYGELHVQGAEQDLHSGVYGGAAPNPIHGDCRDPLRAEGSRRPYSDSRVSTIECEPPSDDRDGSVAAAAVR